MDETNLFERGEINPNDTYLDLLNSLQDLENHLNVNNPFDGFTFDTENIYTKILNETNNVKENYKEKVELFIAQKIKENEHEIITFLDKETKIEVEEKGKQIIDNLNTELNSVYLSLPSSSLGSSSDVLGPSESNFIIDLKPKFSKLKDYYLTLTEHFTQTLLILKRTFPNIKILEYINYLEDYNRCDEDDIDIKKKIRPI